MRIKRDHFLLTRPIAHRGLWGDGVTENSLAAYEQAAANGFPIEIDVYLSKDGVLFSFHDKTLLRMTGADGNIYDKTAEELNSLFIDARGNKIPTLDQVLDLCEGRTPLLIEIKNQPDKQIVDRVVERLKSYKGEFAVQSFNPFYIKRVKKLAPQFVRGILGTDYAEGENAVTRFVVKNMPFNFLIKPDFISYRYSALPLSARKTKNKVVLAWTVTDEQTAQSLKPYADNIIFENFLPL